jgi:tetratricopeptide (TPR) repeat protein
MRLALLFLMLSLAACAAPNRNLEGIAAEDTFDNSKGLGKFYSALKKEGKRNEVLNNMRLGVAAMRVGEKETAKQAFDIAIKGIETVFANNENAQTARSLWYAEEMKEFKGEPYERVMAYYYRGLLYLEDGDYENARAAFKSGLIQDTFAEEEQFRCDFALLMFLESLASKLAGDDEMAKTALTELASFRPDYKQPDSYNVLFLLETGYSPRKVSDGPGHSELKYRRGRNFSEKKALLSIDDAKAIPVYPMEDIYFQAATRGGREIDKILKDKVVFREKNLQMGSTLTDFSNKAILIAPFVTHGGSLGAMQGIAGGIGILGAVQQMIAINAKPQADTRYWDNLPDSVHVLLGNLPSGTHTYKAFFLGDKNNEVSGLARKGEFAVSPTKKLTIVWLTSR